MKRLLQGDRPLRPLFLPILFSLGARIENTPLQAFLSNPTKISNSLRRIRTHVQSDGVSCYFDPNLEAEALGAALEWRADGQPPALRWPGRAKKGQLPEGIRPVDQAAKSGRITVALEVIRRLNSLLRDDSLLMAGLTGPFTLAARMTQLEPQETFHFENYSPAALELAATLLMQISTDCVAAGANLIFIQEDILPGLTEASCDSFAALLAPAINVMRFYQALPVLRLPEGGPTDGKEEIIFRRAWDCAICAGFDAFESAGTRGMMEAGVAWGIALPSGMFEAEDRESEKFHSRIREEIPRIRPAIVTTTGDVPAGIDLKRVLKVLNMASHGE
ncbi:MAG: uroporphyrinogen decarboxylase family protein [Candidatus Acidiferrales bacterium]